MPRPLAIAFASVFASFVSENVKIKSRNRAEKVANLVNNVTPEISFKGNGEDEEFVYYKNVRENSINKSSSANRNKCTDYGVIEDSWQEISDSTIPFGATTSILLLIPPKKDQHLFK